MIAIALCILEIVASWRIFTKAGEQGWKCLIPIYNVYILFKIANNDGFLKLIGASVSYIFVFFIGGLFSVWGPQDGKYIVIIFACICIIAAYIYLLVVLYKMYADLSERFGFERIFALGLLLLNPVFMCIIGFSNAKYRAGATEVNNVLKDNGDTE